MKRLSTTIFTIAVLASCHSKNETVIKPDFVASNIDSSVNPADDFFEYANGNWIKNNPIPGEQSSWGIGNLVIEENAKRLREISEKAATSSDKKGSANQKIGRAHV